MYKMYCFIVITCISSFLVYSISNYNNREEIIEEDILIINEEETIEEKPIIEKLKNNKEEKELMTLEIPKINFKGNIYNKNSKLNNIDKNIIIMKESNMPDEEGGIIIIAGHSGYGKYAYFKHLNKLEKEDIVILNYLNKKYYYKVIDYYLDSKDGSISINNVNKKNKLFLFTCNPNDKNNFLVYNLELFE